MLFLLAGTVAFQKTGASSLGWRVWSVREQAGTAQWAAWAEVQAGSHHAFTPPPPALGFRNPRSSEMGEGVGRSDRKPSLTSAA